MDEVDKKIIAQLQVDGRTSLEDLSKITGFTNTGHQRKGWINSLKTAR